MATKVPKLEEARANGVNVFKIPILPGKQD